MSAVSGSDEFDEIIEQSSMGEPPTDHYTQALQHLDSVVRSSMALSKRCGGIPAPSNKHYWASVLFTTLVVRSVSLLQIAPLSSWAQKVIEHWDYASCSVIARTILEIRLCFFYLCVEECADEEWRCRWETMNLHDCAHRVKLFEALGKQDKVEALRHTMAELVDRISANEHFKTLDPGLQKKVVRGQTAYLKPLESIAEQAGLTTTEFRFFHVFFSTHVHGLPMSFYRVGDERGRGLPTEVESNYTALSLSLTASLISTCRDELEALFKDALKDREELAAARQSRRTCRLLRRCPKDSGRESGGPFSTMTRCASRP